MANETYYFKGTETAVTITAMPIGGGANAADAAYAVANPGADEYLIKCAVTLAVTPGAAGETFDVYICDGNNTPLYDGAISPADTVIPSEKLSNCQYIFSVVNDGTAGPNSQVGSGIARILSANALLILSNQSTIDIATIDTLTIQPVYPQGQ